MSEPHVVLRPRTGPHDAVPVDVVVLARELGVLLRGSLPSDGPSATQVDAAVRRGRLVRVARGAYAAAAMPSTERDRLFALLAGGASAALTGEVACHLLGVQAADRGAAPTVLVSRRSRPGGRPGLVRSSRLPPVRLVERQGRWWPVTRLVRAVADAVRGTDDLHRARAVVGEVLSAGRVVRATLLHELTVSAQRPGCADAVLRDLVAGGVWSPPEGDLLDHLALSAVLPAVEANVLVRNAETGAAVCRPDALIWASALGVGVHSQQHHGTPQAWAATLGRALDAEVLGLLELPVTPHAVATRPQDVLAVVERHSALRYPCGPPEALARDREAPVPRRQPEPTTRPRASDPDPPAALASVPPHPLHGARPSGRC